MKHIIKWTFSFLFLFSPSVFAGTASTTLSVTASVAANCSISTSGVNFGTYDPIAGTNILQSGTVTIACTKGASPTIGLSNNAGGTRNMKNGTELLAYQLYQPTTNLVGASCSPVFGAGTVWETTGSNLFSPTAAPNKNNRTYNICGQVAGGQDVPSGNYSDTVQATVNF